MYLREGGVNIYGQINQEQKVITGYRLEGNGSWGEDEMLQVFLIRKAVIPEWHELQASTGKKGLSYIKSQVNGLDKI